MLSLVEHEKSFITSGPVLVQVLLDHVKYAGLDTLNVQLTKPMTISHYVP